jgi:hypothetical protein
VLAGCNSLGMNAKQGPVMGDPLLGEFGPKGVPPAKTLTPYQKTSAGPVPPIPTANSATSTAALAGGRPLSINGGGFAAASQPAGTLTGSGGIILRPPEAIPSVQEVPLDTHRPGGNTGLPASTWNSQIPSYQQLQDQLRARGVTFQKADPVADGVKLTCIVPNRLNPQVNRFYEATARDYAAAVQAVVQQIDQQK